MLFSKKSGNIVKKIREVIDSIVIEHGKYEKMPHPIQSQPRDAHPIYGNTNCCLMPTLNEKFGTMKIFKELNKRTVWRSVISVMLDLIFVAAFISLAIYHSTHNYRIHSFVFPVMIGGYILTKTLMKVIFKYKDKHREQNDDPLKSLTK